VAVFGFRRRHRAIGSSMRSQRLSAGHGVVAPDQRGDLPTPGSRIFCCSCCTNSRRVRRVVAHRQNMYKKKTFSTLAAWPASIPQKDFGYASALRRRYNSQRKCTSCRCGHAAARLLTEKPDPASFGQPSVDFPRDFHGAPHSPGPIFMCPLLVPILPSGKPKAAPKSDLK